MRDGWFTIVANPKINLSEADRVFGSFLTTPVNIRRMMGAITTLESENEVEKKLLKFELWATRVLAKRFAGLLKLEIERRGSHGQG